MLCRMKTIEATKVKYQLLTNRFDQTTFRLYTAVAVQTLDIKISAQKLIGIK